MVLSSIVLSILTGHQMQMGLDPTLKAEGGFGSCTDCSTGSCTAHRPHPPSNLLGAGPRWVPDRTSFSWHRQQRLPALSICRLTKAAAGVQFKGLAWQHHVLWVCGLPSLVFAVCGKLSWERRPRLGMPDCSVIFRCGSEASSSSTGREARLSEEACNLPAIFKGTLVYVLFSNSKVWRWQVVFHLLFLSLLLSFCHGIVSPNLAFSDYIPFVKVAT